MTTIAYILTAIARCQHPPVHLFCHPDDHARITAACELLPAVRVVAHQLVPAGAVWAAKDLPNYKGDRPVPINPDACPGPCNHRARQAWTLHDAATVQHAAHMAAWLQMPGDDRPQRPTPPQPPTAPVQLGAPVWDHRCARVIRDALAELDDTAAILAASIDGHRGAAMAGPTGVKPADHKTLVESLDALFGDLVEVEDQWRQARGYRPRPRRARGAHARAACVGWLLGQLDDILLHPGSVEFGLAVLKWQRRLRAMAKVDPASKRSPIACPRCRERQVSRREDGYFECVCGRLLTQGEHDNEFARQADEHEQQEAHAL